MNVIRTNFAFRSAAACVALFAWVVLSNHCALSAAFAVKSSPTAANQPGCCKQQPAPEKNDAPCPQMPQGCCKTLKVAVPDGAKVPQASLLEVVVPPVKWLAAFVLALPEEGSAAPVTGPPPDFPSFVELVLHRSLLSHAPPAVA